MKMKRNFYELMNGMRKFSEETFGPFNGSEGVIAHIEEEIEEIKENPQDIEEWADLIILAFDGAAREDFSVWEIIEAVHNKHEKNKLRKWPHWSTVEKGKPINHIKE